MSVKIRLQRRGRKGLPIYAIVAADSRSARDSRFIERLGIFAPKARGAEVPFSLNEERVNHWVSKGAQVTDVVARLLVKHNIGPEAVRQDFLKRRDRRIKVAEIKAKAAAKGEELKAAAAAKAEAEAAAAQAAEAPAEAPAEEAPAAAEEPKTEETPAA